MKHGDHHYFVLHTSDLDASATFFSELLGWDVDDGEIENLAFFGALSDAHDRAIWIHVDDCDATCRKVASLGGVPGDVVDQQSGHNAVCTDDQGNTFHIGTLIEEYRNLPHPDRRPTGELSYFTVPVGDTAAAVDFYGELFGWTFDDSGTSGIQPGYRHCNNGVLEFGFTTGGDVSPGFYFQVADAAGMADRVVTLRGTHGDVVDSETGLTLTGCVAPGDVRFELWQPADGFEPA